MIRRSPRAMVLAAVIGTVMLSAGCGGGSGFSSNSGGQGSGPTQQHGKAHLQVLIASSGDAETKAVKDAASAWAANSGNTVTVTVAQNMQQQLGQAFAANTPPDVFYLDAAQFADYAAQGALWAYGDRAAGARDFYPSLRKAFTWKGTFYCAPKDFSTLALEINEKLWQQAGLRTSDVPTTWQQLTSTLRTLKRKLPKVAPLVISPGHDRADVFTVQAGGRLVTDGKATADTAENIKGLTYLQGLLKQGLVKYSSDVGAGWGGEALGKQQAVMTIEGNWIRGAMSSDFPDVKYRVAALPAGPGGKGTLEFTQCWGIPKATKYRQQALGFVNAMTAADQQMRFAKAFGVMPSRSSVKQRYLSAFTEDTPFMVGADYGVGPVKAPNVSNVLSDYDNELSKLKTTSPKTVLSRLQQNLAAALGG